MRSFMKNINLFHYIQLFHTRIQRNIHTYNSFIWISIFFVLVIRIADFFLIFLSFTSRKAPFFYIKIHWEKSLSFPNPKGLYNFLTNYCYCSPLFFLVQSTPAYIDMGQVGGACLEGRVLCVRRAGTWVTRWCARSWPTCGTWARCPAAPPPHKPTAAHSG